eukprot:TRINITY_DN8529_c0_g1_i1.p1 TRINITY_DN8529_c0_g1~~TRINITY_DN8529_c0_g1_i1.p1  ORF type:complete len:411 (-),score=113.76 TRINITY_DN8529_c0_g1_i1:30-1238(-)
MNAEVVTKTIENKQEAVDYLTWTFFYRRLSLNPNYYNLQGITHRHISDHLSDLIETTLTDLEAAKCVTVEDEMDISALNLGMIACFYNVQYTTIELCQTSLSAKTKLKGLIEILASAAEFEHIPIRHGEEKFLRKMAYHLPLKLEKPNYNDPSTKVNILLQAHFSRRQLPVDLNIDQSFILENATRLLQAIVDVISSNSWLNPALAAMELSQMITQAVWDSDPTLKQVPHFNTDIIHRLKERGVEDIFSLMELEDAERNQLLQLSEREMQNVAIMCNRYPSIDVNYEVSEEKPESNSAVTLNVSLEREIEENEQLASVHAPFYPKQKSEGWWLALGNPKTNHLLSIKRVNLQKSANIKLEFTAPNPGDHQLVLYFMCDSYAGCDQVFDIPLSVVPGMEPMDE